MALGLTQQIPEEDMHSFSDDYMSNRIAVAMGGRIAEELMFGEKTTGAGNDFVQATELARKMVCDWGMSELGPLAYGQNDQPVFLGMDISQGHKAYSEKTAQRIDEQVSLIVTTQYNRARKVLEDNRKILDALSEALLEWETLDTEQVDYVVEGKDLRELQKSRNKARAAEKRVRKRQEKEPTESSTDEDPDSSGPIKDPDLEPA
jgi:cell division protease FtsH